MGQLATTEPDIDLTTTDSSTGLIESFEVLAVEVAIVTLVMLALFVSFAWAILKAGRLPHPSSLITALSLLTFLALIGFLLTEAESLVALASAGVGAIAGAVTTSFKDEKSELPPK